MKLASELTAGLWHSMPAPLEALLARLEALSLAPTFARQREVAMGLALRPYVEQGEGVPLTPLPQEVELATLYLCADFFPEDGQLSLVEQLRDIVTEHIPDEERRWLDPLKHSSMDLVEIVKEEAADDRTALTLRSLGDGRRFLVDGDEAIRQVPVGQVLLTRLIAPPDAPSEAARVIAGCALSLSPADGQALYERVQDHRRSLEAQSGSFAMGEWAEFTKRYGQLLLWNFAQARFDALVEAVTDIRYVSPGGGPFLYALALYEHHELRFLREGMKDLTGFDPELRDHEGKPDGLDEPYVWVFRTPSLVARLTLTPSQLMVECDSMERLEDIKHRLASTFGYALRFRGEAAAPPIRRVSEEDLAKQDRYEVVVTPEEEQAMLRAFLESVYMDWADTSSPALGGQTPRHAAANPAHRDQVLALIRQMDRHDLGRRRTGVAGFDYDRLRAKIGLTEGAA